MKVGLFCGSLGARSANAALLEVARGRIASAGHGVTAIEGLSGAVKNALDWLVGDGTLHRKVLGVASAGTTGGVFAIEQLVRTTRWHGGWVVATLGISGPKPKSDEHGRFTDGDTLDAIVDWADTVLSAVDGPPTHRASLLASIVSPYGIDPARFGTVD